MEKTDQQPGKIWGNIGIECFLSLVLVFGAALAISWPYKSAQLLILLKRPHFYYSFALAFSLSLQLITLVILTCDYIDEKFKWEDDFVKRFVIQAIAGSMMPYILLVLITCVCSLLYSTNMIASLYSRHFIGFSIAIAFAFNALISGYKYACEKECSLNKEKEESTPENLVTVNTYPEFIWAIYGDEKFKLRVNKIAYLQVINKVVLIYYDDHIEYSGRYSLKHLKSVLEPKLFMKINRAFIINRKVLSSYKNRTDGGLQVFLKHKNKEIELSVSADMAQGVVNWIDEHTPTKPTQIHIPCLAL